LPEIGPFLVLEGSDDNNTYRVEFGAMIFSIHPWVANSQLKLHLFPVESMYLSKCITRPRPIEVEGEEVGVVEKIVDDRKKNQHHQFLVYWKGHLEHEATWEPLSHLAGSQELVKEYWY
jgi:hypothetical protein